jgi:hypothetical protein
MRIVGTIRPMQMRPRDPTITLAPDHSFNGGIMRQIREALSRQRKVRADSKHSEREPVPTRWVDLLLYLEEVERTRKQEMRRSEAS